MSRISFCCVSVVRASRVTQKTDQNHRDAATTTMGGEKIETKNALNDAMITYYIHSGHNASEYSWSWCARSRITFHCSAVSY